MQNVAINKAPVCTFATKYKLGYFISRIVSFSPIVLASVYVRTLVRAP